PGSPVPPSTGPSRHTRAVVVGASGFVGSAVTVALRARGVDVVEVHAPRLPPVDSREVDQRLESADEVVAALAATFDGVDVVVNAAGRSDAGSSDLPGMLAA